MEWFNLDNAYVVLIVNAALGIAALVVSKIPGKLGAIVKQLLDVVSANVRHDEKAPPK